MSSFSSWQSYWQFSQLVRNKFRYSRPKETQDFLSQVLKSSEKRAVEIQEGWTFLRAQKGHDWRNAGSEGEALEIPCAYPPERMKPKSREALEGRINPKGIPCLYGATTAEAAIGEVRPGLGAHVSLARFGLVRRARLVDCSRNIGKTPLFLQEPANPDSKEEAVWSHIDNAFSEPTTRGEDVAEYAPTQVIAEMFKHAGFDGLIYKSGYCDRGHNLAFFDTEVARVLSCQLYTIRKIRVEFTESDNPYFITP